MLTLNPYRPLSVPFERMVTATIPTIGLQETDDTVVVSAHLPGVDPHDVEVQASGDRLILWGRQQRHLYDRYGYTVSYEQFQHAIPLPVLVQDDQIQVAFRLDHLVITLPKAQAGTSLSVIKSRVGAAGQTLQHQLHRARTWLGQRLQRWGEQLLD